MSAITELTEQKRIGTTVSGVAPILTARAEASTHHLLLFNHIYHLSLRHWWSQFGQIVHFFVHLFLPSQRVGERGSSFLKYFWFSRINFYADIVGICKMQFVRTWITRMIRLFCRRRWRSLLLWRTGQWVRLQGRRRHHRFFRQILSIPNAGTSSILVHLSDTFTPRDM